MFKKFNFDFIKFVSDVQNDNTKRSKTSEIILKIRKVGYVHDSDGIIYRSAQDIINAFRKYFDNVFTVSGEQLAVIITPTH